MKLVFLTTQPILMFREDDAVLTILTSLISENPLTKILTNISVAASKANDHQDYPVVVIHELLKLESSDLVDSHCFQDQVGVLRSQNILFNVPVEFVPDGRILGS